MSIKINAKIINPSLFSIGKRPLKENTACQHGYAPPAGTRKKLDDDPRKPRKAVSTKKNPYDDAAKKVGKASEINT